MLLIDSRLTDHRLKCADRVRILRYADIDNCIWCLHPGFVGTLAWNRTPVCKAMVLEKVRKIAIAPVVEPFRHPVCRISRQTVEARTADLLRIARSVLPQVVVRCDCQSSTGHTRAVSAMVPSASALRSCPYYPQAASLRLAQPSVLLVCIGLPRGLASLLAGGRWIRGRGPIDINETRRLWSVANDSRALRVQMRQAHSALILASSARVIVALKCRGVGKVESCGTAVRLHSVDRAG